MADKILNCVLKITLVFAAVTALALADNVFTIILSIIMIVCAFIFSMDEDRQPVEIEEKEPEPKPEPKWVKEYFGGEFEKDFRDCSIINDDPDEDICFAPMRKFTIINKDKKGDEAI